MFVIVFHHAELRFEAVCKFTGLPEEHDSGVQCTESARQPVLMVSCAMWEEIFSTRRSTWEQFESTHLWNTLVHSTVNHSATGGPRGPFCPMDEASDCELRVCICLGYVCFTAWQQAWTCGLWGMDGALGKHVMATTYLPSFTHFTPVLRISH